MPNETPILPEVAQVATDASALNEPQARAISQELERLRLESATLRQEAVELRARIVSMTDRLSSLVTDFRTAPIEVKVPG